MLHRGVQTGGAHPVDVGGVGLACRCHLPGVGGAYVGGLMFAQGGCALWRRAVATAVTVPSRVLSGCTWLRFAFAPCLFFDRREFCVDRRES